MLSDTAVRLAAGSEEKREAFRVQDLVRIRFREVTQEEIDTICASGPLIDEDSLAAVTALGRIDRAIQKSIGKVAMNNPELIEFLDLINNKLDVALGSLPAVPGAQAEDNESTCHCSLSASGVAFTNASPVTEGSLVEIRLVLLPNYHHILAFGRVARCAPVKTPPNEGDYEIAVQFTQIHERARDLLVRRSLQRAAEDRRDALNRAQDSQS